MIWHKEMEQEYFAMRNRLQELQERRAEEMDGKLTQKEIECLLSHISEEMKQHFIPLFYRLSKISKDCHEEFLPDITNAMLSVYKVFRKTSF